MAEQLYTGNCRLTLSYRSLAEDKGSMIEITDKMKCCGCGACVQACPASCISMAQDEEGFSYPSVDTAACIGCDACARACPVLQAGTASHEDRSCFPVAVGGWIKDDAIRSDSSSGGAFSLFALHILEQGGVVYGAALGNDMTVRHRGVENPAELTSLRGSKYLQSVIGNTYTEVKKNLEAGKPVLFSGTPCQAAGLRSFLGGKKYDNLVIMDFACHGVPSPLVFSRYLRELEKEYKEPVRDFRFRMKDSGWHPSGTQLGPGTGIRTESGKLIRHNPGLKDPFMNGFVDDAYLRPSCYGCAFKTLPRPDADITIADFWGVNKSYPELYDGKGTSLVLLNSEKGASLFEQVKDSFRYTEVDPEKACRRNPSLTQSAAMNSRRQNFFRDFRKLSFSQLRWKYMNPLIWGLHRAEGILWGMIERLIRAVLAPVLAVLHIRWEEEKWKSFFQFVRFAMVGVSNVLVSYTVNVCTLLLIRTVKKDLPYDYVIANAVAFLVSVFWSWSWNSRKVFKAELASPRDKLRSLLRTYASYAFTGLGLNNLLSTFWIHVVKISRFIAPLLNIPISMPINFFIIKKWAYRGKK